MINETQAEIDKLRAEFEKPTREAGPTIKRTEKRVGRNDPCPCNSGKKFKKCCQNKKAVDLDDKPIDALYMMDSLSGWKE